VVTARGFEFAVDEPASSGGSDTAPMPTEYLLGALASCYALALSWAARKRGLELTPFTLVARGTFDGPRFQDFAIVVRFDGPPPPDVDTLLERAKLACYVSNTLRRGAEIDVTLAEG
jgi:putative redox protein